ncbi:MAG TPA: hypothetical protein PKY59_10105 [Pyrinomonadaceae bacterium]|nr:hypothetical protein [Pyrinomonadaceae bacterium]
MAEYDDVVPDSAEGRNRMLQLMKLNLPGHAATLGLETNEVDQILKDADTSDYLDLLQDAAEAFASEIAKYKRLIVEGKLEPTTPLPVFTPPDPARITFLVGIVQRLRKIIKKIKLSDNYNESIGRDLYIVRERQRTPNEEKQPTLEVKAMADDKVEFKFNKQGMKAVRIRRVMPDGSLQNVADPTDSPYIDDTPSPNDKPEKRQYQAIYLDKNNPVGQYSDIKTVVTTP